MEEHRTRPQQYGPRRGGRGGPPVPSQAARGRPGSDRRAGRPAVRRPAAVRHPSAAPPTAVPALRRLRQLPNPRLTGLGSGLFCGAVMFALGCLDLLLLSGSLTVYGVLFVPVCLLTAVWVRKGDLLIAPVVAPLGFTVGLLPVADGGDGVLGGLMGLVTALATQAVWLYGGTLVAGVTALVRRAALIRRRAPRSRRTA
ncbi:DUF6542 domain-containing protein [Streptomyces sp. NPDC020801]|uniref:DUF6542 domain-containing protein n=1 Tax=unclassified Streptomyces TaxID=2593676 RepID=UPI0037A3C567